MSVKYVCSHTDPQFQSLNKAPTKCPCCGKRMNPITRTIWQGPINQYFHALIEMVCANDRCPFRKEREMSEKGMNCPACGARITHETIVVLVVQEGDILVECPDCDKFWSYTR